MPHKLFSFSSLWVMFAQFEVRCHNLDAARSIFGNAIGRSPKAKIFDEYIKLEMQLGNMERCRAIYEKYEPDLDLQWAILVWRGEHYHKMLLRLLATRCVGLFLVMALC